MGHWCEDTYGLMRAEVLDQTGLLHLYTDGDRTLLAHMALMGRYFEVQEPLFFRRLHPESSVNTYPEWQSRMFWFGNEYATKITLPHWMQLRHYLQVIVRTPNDL